VTPIVVWRRNNVIYKGNTTWKALRLLGERMAKVLFVDFPSEQAAVAYGIADNKSSEWAQWDEGLLTRFLTNDAVELHTTGFTETERNFLFSQPDAEKIERINARPVAMRDKVVVLIVDHTSREDVVALLQEWITASGLKNIRVWK